MIVKVHFIKKFVVCGTVEKKFKRWKKLHIICHFENNELTEDINKLMRIEQNITKNQQFENFRFFFDKIQLKQQQQQQSYFSLAKAKQLDVKKMYILNFTNSFSGNKISVVLS